MVIWVSPTPLPWPRSATRSSAWTWTRRRSTASTPHECPIYEDGLPELLSTHTATGRLRFTTSLAEAAEFADIHFLAVGTPIDADGRSYDTGQVFGAARALAPHLTRPTVIVGKSTVTVGTSRDLGALLARLSPAGEDVEVVWNPEFLREGHAIDDTLRPDRIVVGVPSARAEDAVREVYAPLLANGIPLFVTDPATAELIKGAANAYLGMKISFINGVADMCTAAGADVQQLTEAIGLDPRIGRGGLNAGFPATAAAASRRTSAPSPLPPAPWAPPRQRPCCGRRRRSTNPAPPPR